MAFSFFIALFPAIIFMFTLVAYLPIPNFDQVIRAAIHDVIPENAHAFLFETVDEIRSIPRGGLLSLGFILAILFASNGFMTMIRGFEKSYEVTFKARKFVRKQGIAIGLTLLVGVLFLVCAILIISGTQILGLLFDESAESGINRYVFQFLRWGALFFLYYSIIAVLYRFGPPLYTKFKFFSPGTNLATLLSLIISILFTYAINNFGTQDRIYGPLGALIVMLLWIQINCLILLIGFELNASIAVNRDLRNRLDSDQDR